ncbi:hypothetical protein AV530_013331 [Patagioenas fasciata monilis]|uniref:Uncharacterized protein n=1 Tax=Patagioenas fasciata monilis TaxID=372326 RepID=A0A1V4JNY8_PATFA|nr:hypothetical protein AV530_013331 [Patagioenas fasciata monilis]
MDFLSFMVILNFIIIFSLVLGNLCPRRGAAAAEEAVEKARGLTGLLCLQMSTLSLRIHSSASMKESSQLLSEKSRWNSLKFCDK